MNIAGALRADTIEARSQISVTKSGGDLSDAAVYVSANTNAVTTTFDIVINSTVGNQSIAVGAGLTGLFTDASTDTISASDEVNWEITASAWVSLTMRYLTVSYTPSTFHHIFTSMINSDICRTSGAYFSGVNHSSIINTETNAKLNMKIAGTLEKARAFITANASTTADVIVSRINGANGNISIAITAATTGEFLDSSNTDSISVDNDINWSGDTSTTGNVTVQLLTVAFTPTVSGAFIGNCGLNDPDAIANTTVYSTPGTQVNTETTEVNAIVPVSSDYTVTNLQTYISLNDGGSAGTFDLRVDTGGGPASSALTISITAATTGWFEDSTNSVSLNSGDKIDYRVVGPTTGSFRPTTLSAKFVDASVVASTSPGYIGGGYF